MSKDLTRPELSKLAEEINAEHDKVTSALKAGLEHAVRAGTWPCVKSMASRFPSRSEAFAGCQWAWCRGSPRVQTGHIGNTSDQAHR